MNENSDALYLRLGLLPGATRDEVASAYRHLAHRTHPDARPEDPGAADRFQEITEAFQVLSDNQQRPRYDSGRAYEARREGAGRADRQPSVPVHRAPMAAGPPVRLGPSARSPNVPLRTGPVHIEPGSPQCPVAHINKAELVVAEWHLLAGLFERWRS